MSSVMNPVIRASYQQLTCTSKLDTGSLSCSNLTLTGSLTLPTCYSSAPSSTSLGYILQAKNTKSVTMNAGSPTSVCSITLPAVVWMVLGVACFFPSTTSTSSTGSVISPTFNNMWVVQVECFLLHPCVIIGGNGTPSYLMSRSASRLTYFCVWDFC